MPHQEGKVTRTTEEICHPVRNFLLHLLGKSDKYY